MVTGSLLLFALPAAVIVVGTVIILARGASRPSVNWRKIGLIALPIMGCFSMLVGLGFLVFLLVFLMDSDHGEGGRRYRRRNGFRYHDPDRKASRDDIRQMQTRGVTSLECTNGWRPVYGSLSQVQTFKAPRGGINHANFRLARNLGIPGGSIRVSIREARSRKQLASWTLSDFHFGKNAVTRFFQPYTARFKNLRLKEGRSYEVVFSSRNSTRHAPWLVNCFYRDTLAASRHYTEKKGRPGGRAQLDLVLQLGGAGGDALLSTIPQGKDMGRREHFGLSYAETVERLRQAVKPPDPGSNPTVSGPAPALDAPAPRMTRREALAAARKLGKTRTPWVDAVDSRLTWIPLEKNFLAVFDSRDGSLTEFKDFLSMVGRTGVDVTGLAFTSAKVFAATDRGALVYDRRTRSWGQLAINLDTELLEAPVAGVSVSGGKILFDLEGKGSYGLELKDNKWSRLRAPSPARP